MGLPFADFLQQSVEDIPILLAIQTDTYGSREWCRLEVLEAKKRSVPIVVLTATERGEARSFPYMGNVPVIRWTDTLSLVRTRRRTAPRGSSGTLLPASGGARLWAVPTAGI